MSASTQDSTTASSEKTQEAEGQATKGGEAKAKPQGKPAQSGEGEKKPAAEATETKAKAPESKSAKPGDLLGDGVFPTSEGAPEAYELKIPEGIEVSDGLRGAFEGEARELNLTNAKAQKFLDRMLTAIQEQEGERLEGFRSSWAAEAKSDKEFGGAKFAANLDVANQALRDFGDDELRDVLAVTGLANHRAVIRLLWNVGRRTSEEAIHTGQPRSPKPVDRKDPAAIERRMFPSMFSETK